MATRLYFQATTAAPISPAFDAAWLSTAEGVRRNLVQSKEAATETVAGTLTGSANDQTLAVQAVSLPLSGAQTISGTWNLVVRGRELDAADNVNRRVRAVTVVSNDGTTVRGTLLAHSTAGSTTEYGTTLSGVSFAASGGISSVNASDGDRIVVELGPGSNTTGTTPQWEYVLGGTGTDHANSNGDTTGTVSWIEFSTNLTFNVIASATAATGTGVANSATVQIAPHAEATAGTGTAYDATVRISPQAGVATGTGTANDATALTGTVASATAAAGTGSAYDATVKVSPTATAATGSGTAPTPAASVAPSASAASGTGVANDAHTQVAPTAGIATGIGAAFDATVKISPSAGVATGIGAAFDATVSFAAATTAYAEAAAGTGIAFDATVLAVSAPVQVGSWYGLLSILREASESVRAEQARGPVACPNDGEPLRAGPGGGLYCPWDGWTPSGSYVGG